MLIYERFVFIHMPKTAGTFIRNALTREFGPPVQELGRHAEWEAIPTEAAELPVLVFVRNPWDWYVSWYHFHLEWLEARCSPEWIRGSTEIRRLFGDDIEISDGVLRGYVDFAAFIRNACTPTSGERRAIQQVAELEDFYAYRFWCQVGAGLESAQLTVGRFEFYLDDLERFFRRNKIPVADEVLLRIGAGSPVNRSRRGPYRQYYSDDLRELVERSCPLVERFGYRFKA